MPRALRVRTLARDREEFLSHPPSGERILDEDAARIRGLYSTRRPQVQVVVSDRVRAVIRAEFGYEARFTHFPLHGRCGDCATAP